MIILFSAICKYWGVLLVKTLYFSIFTDIDVISYIRFFFTFLGCITALARRDLLLQKHVAWSICQSDGLSRSVACRNLDCQNQDS